LYFILNGADEILKILKFGILNLECGLVAFGNVRWGKVS
jgi:hypothetical protein